MYVLHSYAEIVIGASAAKRKRKLLACESVGSRSGALMVIAHRAASMYELCGWLFKTRTGNCEVCEKWL